MKEDKEFPFELKESKTKINMNEVTKDHDILFLCFDTLRYDVAKKLEAENKTPVLNRYGSWQECMAPGNFTYPSHQSMFIGFLPAPINAKSIKDRDFLFFPKRIELGNIAPKTSFAYEGESFIESHEKSLEYVDKNLEELFKFFKNRGKTFVIATSDHGTCYGEDGYNFHGFNHPIVNHIPYKHFFL